MNSDVLTAVDDLAKLNGVIRNLVALGRTLYSEVNIFGVEAMGSQADSVALEMLDLLIFTFTTNKSNLMVT